MAGLGDSVIVNPSSLAFQELQGGAATYDWLNHQPPAVASTTQRVIHAVIYDGRNSLAVGGLSFTRRPDLDLIHFGIAKKLLPWFSLGGTAKRYSVRDAYKTITRDATGYDGGLSATASLEAIKLLPIQVGVTVDNLINRPSDEFFLGGRKVATGVRGNLKDILFLNLDYARALRHSGSDYNQLSAAAEIALGGGLFARGGLIRLSEKGWGVGGSWMAPKIGFTYGYQKRTSPRSGFEHALQIDVYM
jgi:hypothetical protein